MRGDVKYHVVDNVLVLPGNCMYVPCVVIEKGIDRNQRVWIDERNVKM